MKGKICFITILLVIAFLSAATASQKVTLAVLSFYSESKTGNNIPMGTGFAETLVNKLNKLQDVNVVDRESQRSVLEEMGISQKFEPPAGQSLGHTIGADYIITGTLKEDGNRVSITSQLFDVKKGTVVAEETVTGLKDNLFALQGDLSLKIAKYFNTPVSQEIKKDLYFMPTQNMGAFEKFSSGLQLYEKNRGDEAYNFFINSIKKDTGFLDAHRYFEYTARKLGKLDEFIILYKSMLASDPKNPILMNYLGNGYLDKGNLVEAEKLYIEAIRTVPTFANPYNNLASVYMLSRKYEEALATYQKALVYSDEKASIFYNTGMCYKNMKDNENAKKYFQKALDLEPSNPDFIIARKIIYGINIVVGYREKPIPGTVLGEILINSEPVFEIQNTAGGLTPLKRAEVIARRLYNLIARGLNGSELEVGKMNKEVVIETMNRELIMTVTADLARREGTTPEKLAKSTMDILKEKLNYASSDSTNEYGLILQPVLCIITENSLKQLQDQIDTGTLQPLVNKEFSQEQLEEELEKLNFNPEEIELIMNYKEVKDLKPVKGNSEEASCLHKGDTFYSQGKYDRALTEYENALKINPSFAPAQLSIAIILYDRKDFAGAATNLNKVINSNPDYTDAYIWLGKTCMAEGKTSEAKAAFLKALNLAPGNTEVKGYLEKL